MQIVIEINDIPKNDHERWVLEHGTPLPEDATNGDVLSLLFQNDSFRITADKNGYLHIRGVKKEWWNAKYKVESEDKE